MSMPKLMNFRNIQSLYRDEFTATEIQALTKDQFHRLHPFELRSCYNCGNIVSIVNFWCMNKEAILWRGTAIPGGIKCKYWVPNKEIIFNQKSYSSDLTISLFGNRTFIIEIKRRFIGKFLYWFFLKFGKVNCTNGNS